MSYCALVVFDGENKATRQIEFRNSWGGAALIWSSLFEKYIKAHGYDHWLSKPERLWALAYDPRLADVERTVLVSTFDNCILRRKDFGAFAAMLRKFSDQHASAGVVNHLPSWADGLGELPEDATAVGWWGTSVCENPWSWYDEDLDDQVVYEITAEGKHWFLRVPEPLREKPAEAKGEEPAAPPESQPDEISE